MSVERIDEPAAFLEDFGHLHDVAISAVTYDAVLSTISLTSPDLNRNFEGQPGQVARPVRLVLEQVSAFSLTAGQDKFHTSLVSEGAQIAHADAITKGNVSRLDVVMSTGERWHVEFASMSIHEGA